MASSLVKSFIGSFGGIQRSLLVKPVGRQSVSLSSRRFSSSPVENEVRIVQLEGENEGVCTLTFNKPQTKNAIGRQFISKMQELIDYVRNNRDTVRTVILNSEVKGAFCVGADLKERATIPEDKVAQYVMAMRSTITAFSELPVPIIAAIDGYALGGGLEISLACDLRVASDDAKIGLVETRLAIIPGGGGTQRLPRLIGMGKAKELIFTAKVLGGEEAADIGLVEHSVTQNGEGNAAYVKALEIAREISTKGPVAVAAAKQAINHGMQVDLYTGLKFEESCYNMVIPTEDRIEALKAFREKRPAVFKGK